MANYFGGICHLRTIKPVRRRSWHPVWSTKCGVFRQVERAARAGQFQSQKGQKLFQMTDLSKITFTFENAQTRGPSDSTGPVSWFFFCFVFGLFLFSTVLLHLESKSTGILERSVSWDSVFVLFSPRQSFGVKQMIYTRYCTTWKDHRCCIAKIPLRTRKMVHPKCFTLKLSVFFFLSHLNRLIHPASTCLESKHFDFFTRDRFTPRRLSELRFAKNNGRKLHWPDV